MPKHRNKITLVCRQCKNPFEVWPNRIRRENPKFCSMKCRNIAWSNGNHPSYRGKPHMSHGYWFLRLPGQRRATAVHRIVAEKKLGRKLRIGEVVHHINAIKTDNEPENITIFTISGHIKHHNPKLIAWAKRFDRCISCGTSVVPHQAKGLCSKCCKRKSYIIHRKIHVSRAACDARWVGAVI
jgi:hypothetical protein